MGLEVLINMLSYFECNIHKYTASIFKFNKYIELQYQGIKNFMTASILK